MVIEIERGLAEAMKEAVSLKDARLTGVGYREYMKG